MSIAKFFEKGEIIPLFIEIFVFNCAVKYLSKKFGR